jgi:hypothetical protein
MSAVIIFVIGSLLMAYGLHAYWYYSPKRWRQIHARVLSSAAERLPSETGQLFVPKVYFDYVVDGQRYVGHEYAFSSSEDADGLNSVKELLRSYAQGDQITVWYQVNKPKNSCIKLMSSYSRSQMAAIALGGLIVNALGIFLYATIL